MENLFTKIEDDTKSIRLLIYCDEIKQETNSLGEKWMYLGALFIPENKKDHALTKLNEARKEADYFDELHFTKLTNYSYAKVHNKKTLLAKKWIEILKRDAQDKDFYWSVIGINCSNLNFQFFGDNKRTIFQNVYNRFFRTLLKSSFNNFFPELKIIVKNIYHDTESHLNQHHYFDWHCIYSLSHSMKNVWFDISNISFVDSDHYKEETNMEESHFIQFIDLILGAFHQAFDNSSNKDGKVEIGKSFGELLLEMKENPKNVNHKYGYFRKYSFSFFPSKKVKSSDVINSWERISSKFYINRNLLGAISDQPTLFINL